MKKLLIIILLFISSYTVANNDSIMNVSVEFCNENIHTKHLMIETSSWDTKDICMQFTNLSKDDLTVWYQFVDWIITDDKFWVKACKDHFQSSVFDDYIDQYQWNVFLKAKSQVEQTSNITIPFNNSGVINWCLVYFIIPDQNTDKANKMLDVLLRKALFVDIYPKWQLNKTVKDHSSTTNKDLVIPVRFVLYAAITLIIIIFTIITWVKQRRKTKKPTTWI